MPCCASFARTALLRQRRRDRAVEALDHRGRRLRRREQRATRRRPRRPATPASAKVGTAAAARARSALRDAERAQLAGLDLLRDQARQRRDATDRCGRRAARSSSAQAPLNGTCSMSMPALVLNSSVGEMRARAVAGRAEGEPAGLGLGQRDQLGDARRPQRPCAPPARAAWRRCRRPAQNPSPRRRGSS